MTMWKPVYPQPPGIEEGFILIAPNGAMTNELASSHLHRISRHVEDLSDDLRALSLSIHDHPELQYKEFHAHRVLTEYLEKQDGWAVTPSAYGIPTAFVAVFDSGEAGPTVSFNSEYDALKGIGHACGHNLIAISSLGAALATAKLVHEEGLGGKVVLFGTPAEEGGGGKIKLLDAGAYKDVDVSLMSHPGITPNAALVRSTAYVGLDVEYFGKAAHAAARPWDGINALDALITAYNALSVLRQQTHPTDVITGMITNGGARPNIIHEYASGRFVIRAQSKAYLEQLKRKVVRCFEGAATATGATLKITWKMAYDDTLLNHVLARRYRDAFNQLGGEIPIPEVDVITGATQASSDQGNVSYALPSLQSSTWIRSEDEDGKQLGGPHSPDFAKAARTPEAHEMFKRAAKALAMTAVDVLTIDGLLEEIRRDFEDAKRQSMQSPSSSTR